MTDRTATTKVERAPGILDHISDGMSLLLIAPWLILIPILIDLALIVSPTVSSGPLYAGLAGWVSNQDGQIASDFGQWVGARGNADTTGLIAVLLPSVIEGVPSGKTYSPFDPGSIELSSFGVAMAVVGFLAVGSLGFVAYLVWLASAGELLRDKPISMVRTVFDRWLKLLALAGTIAAVFGSVVAVVILPSALFNDGQVSGELLISVLSLIGLILLVLTMFVPEAIVIDAVWPISAIRRSATVVIRSFWQSLGFLAVSLLISPGLLSIWEQITHQAVGLGIAIVLNAAAVTSVALASLSFYRTRIDRASQSPQSVQGE